MAPRHEIELDPAEAEIELETAEPEQGLDEPLVEAEIEADSLPLPDEDEPLLEAEPLAAAPAARGEDAFASDLAEADFYIESGLSEEARAILEAILMGEPKHPGALARLRRIGGAGQKTLGTLRPAAAQRRPAAAPAVASTPEHDDLAAELAAELAA